jgi:hypothetical protein
LLVKVQQNPSEYSGYKAVDRLIFFKDKLFIPTSSSFKKLLLEEFHDSPIGGHSGVEKTYGRLRENVYWNGMKKDVADFVQRCLICQQTKPPNHLPYGLLQPLPIPTGIWEDISLDFITGLPSFQTSTVILVVVDRFSKAAHFGFLPTQFTACKVAELFTKMVFQHHGMPKSMVFDRDPIFMSKFWQQLFKLNGTKLRMSSAYHPQSDGQTEIVNKALQQYLRCFANAQPHQWGKFLRLAEWHYNTSIHSSTGLSPFQVVYGKPPPSLPQYIHGSSSLEALDSDLTTRDEILTSLRRKLEKAQETMKKYADNKRIAHTFGEGDLVLVKLRPYRQTSVASHRLQKLSKRFFGPFRIKKQIGEVAFELDLPPTSRIHPVFHASKLKLYHGSEQEASPLPPEAFGDNSVVHPIAFLDKQVAAGRPPKVLVQWSNSFPEDATWETLADIETSFPNLDLEDKVMADGVGDVTAQEEEQQPNEDRPKRSIVKPKKYDDFEMPKKLK